MRLDTAPRWSIQAMTVPSAPWECSRHRAQKQLRTHCIQLARSLWLPDILSDNVESFMKPDIVSERTSLPSPRASDGTAEGCPALYFSNSHHQIVRVSRTQAKPRMSVWFLAARLIFPRTRFMTRLPNVSKPPGGCVSMLITIPGLILQRIRSTSVHNADINIQAVTQQW